MTQDMKHVSMGDVGSFGSGHQGTGAREMKDAEVLTVMSGVVVADEEGNSVPAGITERLPYCSIIIMHLPCRL